MVEYFESNACTNSIYGNINEKKTTTVDECRRNNNLSCRPDITYIHDRNYIYTSIWLFFFQWNVSVFRLLNVLKYQVLTFVIVFD